MSPLRIYGAKLKTTEERMRVLQMNTETKSQSTAHAPTHHTINIQTIHLGAEKLATETSSPTFMMLTSQRLTITEASKGRLSQPIIRLLNILTQVMLTLATL